MTLKTGDIIHAYCHFVSNYKYIICVCPKYPYFFFINSEPRRQTPGAQIEIKKEDFPFLSHDSYINTATLFTIYANEVDKSTPMGSLPSHVKTEIIKVISNCGYLSPNHKALITSNLVIG
jgi:hypothetical protein